MNMEQQRRLYGRRKGRPLRQGQQALFEELYPRLEIQLGDNFDPTQVFDDRRNVWLEVGFGKGEHLCAQAKANPEVGIIGCEPFINGMAAALQQIHDDDIQNVRLLNDDARKLLDVTKKASIDRAFVLHPDPWPKRHHAKRRFFNPETLDRLAYVLKDGAELRLATDDRGYSAWALMQIEKHPDFEWRAKSMDDWVKRPEDWPMTRYGEKALRQGRNIVFFSFYRKPRCKA
ncbi:MAG: tRNA (guanosine(46)-N7)-methyltransferase TrmB [Sphingomonadales bacterium]|jgi:tRNA (guanine-N7-)-methyltransferase